MEELYMIFEGMLQKQQKGVMDLIQDIDLEVTQKTKFGRDFTNELMMYSAELNVKINDIEYTLDKIKREKEMA